MTTAYVMVCISAAGLLMAVMGNICLVAYIFGVIRTTIAALTHTIEKLDNAIDELYNKTNSHGERIASIEADQRHYPRMGAEWRGMATGD